MVKNMNKKLSTTLALFFLLLVAVCYNNCSSELRTINIQNSGTVTGNPLTPVSSQIMFAVCGTVTRCHAGVDIAVCHSAVLKTSGFAVPLALPPAYDTFSSIFEGEQGGAIVGNLAASASCYNKINTLSCADPLVVSAYDSTSSNPYAGTPGLVTTATCDQAFKPGTNIEVPIELVDYGLASKTTVATFSRSRTSLDTTDYDGDSVTYSFEVVAENSSGATKNAYLIDSLDSVVATLAIPATAGPTRLRTSFAPTPGANNYRIRLDATSSAGRLATYTGRILVRQVGATRTKIYIPLMAGMSRQSNSADDQNAHLDDSTISSYSQPNGGWYSLWKKNISVYSQLAATNPWTFEAVMSAESGGTAYASLFNANTNLQIATSELTTTSSSPDMITRSFSDSSAGFNNLDNIEVRIKEVGGTSHIYHAGIWLKLENLSHGEVFYRELTSENWTVGSSAQDENYARLLPDLSLYLVPTFYHELVANVDSGTSCSESLFDNGVSDATITGIIVSGSTLTMSSVPLTIQRTSALSLIAGHRYSAHMSDNNGPGGCYPVNSFLVIKF
jgi:hypothetical protein